MTIGRGAGVTDPSEKPSRAVPGPGGPGVPGSGGPGVPGSGGPGVSGSGGLVGGASAALDRRIGPGGELADRAEQSANAAHAMAVRFHQGGKRVVFGTGGASTDAQHIAVAGGTVGAIAADGCPDHLLTVGSVDPRIIKEIHVTTYHVLWELVHVFFEQPGALGPGVVS